MTMLLNGAKKTAILHLLNCMSSSNVLEIPQLHDARLICDMIKTVYPEIEFDLIETLKQEILNSQGLSKDGSLLSNVDFQSDYIIVEDSKTCSESVSGAVQLSDTELNISTVSDRESVTEHVNHASSNVEADTKPITSASAEIELVTKPVKLFDGDISQKYRLIQHFIDVRYNVKSHMLIRYSECRNKNEFELAIVSIFILSEVVRHFVHVNNPVIHTLSLLDIDVQQDLEELFNFFINERSKITREEVEKILASQTLYKNSSSPNRSYFVTPKRSCSSKYKRSHSSSTSPLQESVYTDSPLKTYFESPIFTRADIVSKEKEIFKIRQILYEEEAKCNSLHQKVKDLERKLKEKDKEMKHYKEMNRMLVENETSKDYCGECKKYEKIIEEKESYIEELEKNGEKKLKETVSELQENFIEKFSSYQVEVAEKLVENVGLFREAERKINATSIELDQVKEQNEKFQIDNEKLSRKLDEMADKLKLCEEKLSAASASNDLDSSVPGECIDEYLEENKFQMDISQEKLVDPEEITARQVDQCPEQKIDEEYRVELNTSVMSEVPVSNDACDSEEFQNLKKCSENVNEEYSSVCDVSNKLHATSNQCPDSPSKEVLFTDNSYPVTNDGIGSLWHLYNNSISENDNAEGVSCVNNGLTKALNILQKAELEINQMSKHLSAVSKSSSGPNGSNGLVGNSPMLKEFLEDLKKYVRICLSCLDQTRQAQAKFQNNNSISENIAIDEAGCNSNSIANSKCFECLKVGSDLPSNISTVNQDNTALLEKIKEIDSWKEKYQVIVSCRTIKDREMDSCKKKYSFLKREYLESLKNYKETKLKCQQLYMEIQDVKKRESDFKRESKREKCVLKMQIKDMEERFQKLQNCVLSCQVKVKELSGENKKLRDEIYAHKIQNEELSKQIKYLEKQIEDFSSNVQPAALSNTTNVENEELSSIKDVKDEYTFSENASDDIVKPEILSPSLNEVTSFDTGNESQKFGALCNRSLLSRSGFHLVTDDEESFVNHRSLIGAKFESADDQSDARLQELQRRNSMYPNHLQSTYPAEGVPMTPTEKVLPEHVHGKKRSLYIGKKRKVSEMEAQNQSSQSLTTPIVKAKRKFLETPTSLKRWRLYRRNQRSGSIKPKP